MVLVEGRNGEGKSNLLEAVYLLAIAKSPRASSDRELVRRGAYDEGAQPQAHVAAVARSDGGESRIQIGLSSATTAPSSDGTETNDRRGAASGPPEAEPASVQKQIRVNGVPRRASDLVGELNAVMFTAQDLELALGPPAVRRRYLDILISQLDRGYLRALQRYQRVVAQRNHLLKAIRAGRSGRGELDFWNDELSSAGSYIMAARATTVAGLSQIAAPILLDLNDQGGRLQIAYRPSVDGGPESSEADLAARLKGALEEQAAAEVSQGFTLSGPHRDDLQMFLGGLDVGVYASRGQCRTVVLAMRLAEAAYLERTRGEGPVVLLDDVLSELDSATRTHVLDHAVAYQQCFITTADPGQIDEGHLSRATRFVVRDRQVTPVLASSEV